MSQYQQENDMGGGGGEVDDETMSEAWENAAERLRPDNIDEPDAADDDGPQPWAKASSGDVDKP